MGWERWGWVWGAYPDNVSIETEEVEEFLAVHLFHGETIDHEYGALL